MKLTFLLLTAAMLNISAKGTSQTVSFNGNNIPLQEVLSAVKKQTGFSVFYKTGLLNKTNPVSLNVMNIPLVDFLQQVFRDQPLGYSIKNTTIAIFYKGNSLSAVDLKSTAVVLMPPGSLLGRVMNEYGEPLAGASVTIKGTSQGGSADINGYYKIENIAVGEYTLVVSYVGYATKESTIKVAENGAANVNFKLTPSLVNLDEMTVTSTLSKRAIRAYPATIAVITQADLKNRNLNNIANVLESIPGVIITPGSEMDNSGNTRQPYNLLIRGTSAGAPIKYLVDGVEIVSLGGPYSILQSMDPNTIEKIEVLKGPMASTLYGSGAAGGIIAITTKKGKSGKSKVNFKTMFTDQSNDYANYKGYQQDYSLNVSGGNEQFNYLIGAAYNLYPTTKLTDINNGIEDKTWAYNAKIGGKVKNIAADLSLQYGTEKNGAGSTAISDNKYRASLGLSTYPPYPLEDYRNFHRSFLTSLHLTHTIADNCYQDLTIGYNIVNYGSADYTSNGSTYAYSEYLYSKINARYFLFYDYNWSKGIKTNITAGLEYNSYETHSLYINSTTPLTDFFASSTPATASSASFTKSPYSSTGYFAEAVTGFKNKLFLTTGIRYDVNPAYGDNIGGYSQPRVGLSYVIEPGNFKIKPRIVWGVSSTPPEPFYKISVITPYPQYGYIQISEGNPDIKPQRSQGYELGADLFYGSNYSLNVTWYDQKIKDMIQNSSVYDGTTNPATNTSYFYNIANAINRGLEVSAKAVFNPFTVDVSYTQTTSKWGDQIIGSPSATVYPRAPNLGVPKKSIFTRLSYKIPSLLPWTEKGGNISLDWRYNGSAFDLDIIGYSLATNAWNNSPDPKPAFPDYTKYYLWQKGYSFFNLRADYSVTNFATLYVDVQNLLDKQGSVNGQILSRFPGRRINFGVNITF